MLHLHCTVLSLAWEPVVTHVLDSLVNHQEGYMLLQPEACCLVA